MNPVLSGISWLSQSGLTLTIANPSESAKSEKISFTYSGSISPSTGTLTSPTTAFEITMLQRACMTGSASDGKGTYDATNINLPKHGTSSSDYLDLAADGTTKVIEMQDAGAPVTDKRIFDMGGTFASRCGDSTVTLKSGPSWLTFKKDNSNPTQYKLTSAPQNEGVAEYDVTITVAYALFADMTKDFSFKINVTTKCSLDVFQVSATAPTSNIMVYFGAGAPVTTTTIPTWTQT